MANKKKRRETGEGAANGCSNMVKCDGCGSLVKRSKAILAMIDNKQRFFCCKGCTELFRQKYETLLGVKQ